MTKIKIFKNSDNITAIECSGHSDYNMDGFDIVCASISIIVQNCALGLKDVLKVKPKISKNDKIGYMKIELPKNMSLENLEKSQILLKTAEAGLWDIQSGYSKYISIMEVIE